MVRKKKAKKKVESKPIDFSAGTPPSDVTLVGPEEPVEAKSTESKPEETREEPKEKPKSHPSDIVKVKVLIGTFQWEGGKFSKGDVFEAPRQRAERMEKTSVQILD